MNPYLRSLCRGLGSSALSLALYTIALMCFNALMLLIVSMEEGGQGLTDYTMEFTKSVILLSQGTGVDFQTIHLTLTPLGLTLLLIILIRSVSFRFGCSLIGYCSGAALWAALHAWMLATLSVTVVGVPAVAILKSVLVFSIGYLFAWLPGTDAAERFGPRNWAFIGPEWRRAIGTGLFIGGVMLLGLLLAGTVVTVVWIVLNAGTVGDMYTIVGMDTGSAVMTTIACLIWLPNCVVWALSWVCGGGFSVGETATFSLWADSSQAMPAVPVFGVFPQAVGDDAVRIALMLLPCLIAMIVSIWPLMSPTWFDMLAVNPSGKLLSWDTARRFGFPAVSLCLSCIIISLATPLMFLLSNGSLGRERLAHVGVSVASSTQVVVRPAAIGLLAAWLLTVVIACLRYAVLQLRGNRVAGVVNVRHDGEDSDDIRPRRMVSGGFPHTSASEPESGGSSTVKPRTSRSIASENHHPTTKEDR
ncbi:hypothetical protein KIH77_05180 [Bifidobacterium sp. 82T24]|uniref:cell division protein PerM n=1 Tax=Bifidobacterium pluvialisilvae TaxID=2834436 RepID=UPI001C562D69|nr:DUF6350 family protein [Bifidobacterium pluvialisilvae]MBW3088122.1 hypothetical protein [Bifidobacterium pluvialisilvae]